MSARCEVLTSGHEWREAPVESLEPGRVFRLREESGELREEQGCWRWRALGAPTQNGDGTWDVEAEAVPETDVERAVRAGGLWWPGSSGLRPAARAHMKG